jgi:hypothetical protein
MHMTAAGQLRIMAPLLRKATIVSQQSFSYRRPADIAILADPKYPVYITNGAGGHWDGLDNLNYQGNFSAKLING